MAGRARENELVGFFVCLFFNLIAKCVCLCWEQSKKLNPEFRDVQIVAAFLSLLRLLF